MRIRNSQVVSIITIFFLLNLVLGEPFVWAQASFDDSAKIGRESAKEIMQGLNPTTMNDAGIVKIVPHGDEAAAQKDGYTSYYGNPSSMTGGSSTEIAKTVTDIKTSRQIVDLSEDSTFGTKCRERDAEGKCLSWSLTEDILRNTYEDCETIIVPVYGDKSETKTCTGEHKEYQKDCSINLYANVQQEVIAGTCDAHTPEYQPGQIFARCKDIYEWYKVPAGEAVLVNDGDCYNSGGAKGCFSTNNYVAVDAPPSDAVFFAKQHYTYELASENSGWDSWRVKYYNWYFAYKYSIVERVFLMEDTNCSDFDTLVEKSCTVRDLTMCSQDGLWCFESIKDGQETGILPLMETNLAVARTEETEEKYCYEVCNYDNFSFLSCPISTDCTGYCPLEVVNVTAAPGYYQKVGENTVISGSTDQCESGNLLNLWGTLNKINVVPVDYYINEFSCKTVSGEADNYQICLKYDGLLVGDSHSFGQATTTPVREDWVSPEILKLRDGQYSPFSRNEYSVRGGPDVRPYRNIWKMTTKLDCISNESDCDSLVAQGCSYLTATCLNDDCTEREMQYMCGGDGSVATYEKTYVCAGQLRCMGNDCGETIEIEAGDFAKAAAASEVLNMIRSDSGDGQIFPGKAFECQSSPKNCCDESAPGVNVMDYVEAGRAAYDLAATLMDGTTTSEAGLSAATDVVNTAYAGLESLGVVPELAGTLTSTITEGIATAAETVATEVITAVAGEAAVEGAMAAIGAVMACVATVLWIVAILYLIYAILSFLYKLMFSCTEDDMVTSVKLTLRLCHLVGEKNGEVLGMNLKKKNVYCCFNSILARIVHEQGRKQIGRGWGDGEHPECNGFSVGELNQIDFTNIDLSEYMRYVKQKSGFTDEEQSILVQQAVNYINETNK